MTEEKLALVTFDPVCDCGCRRVIALTTLEKAKRFVQSQGQYSDYNYIEVQVGEVDEGGECIV